MGPAGPAGPEGDIGPQGPQGVPGTGVPAGGATDQVLAKASAADHDTGWRSLAPAAFTTGPTRLLSYTFATVADRDTALVGAWAPVAGTRAYTPATGEMVYTGTAWAPLPGTLLASLRQTVKQTVPNNTITAVTLNQVDYDRFAAWSVANSRFTVPFTGWYELTGAVCYVIPVGSIKHRAAHFYKTSAIAANLIPGSGNYWIPADIGPLAVARTTPVLATAGEFLGMSTFQFQGAALDTNITDQVYTTAMQIKWLGPPIT